MKNSKTKNIRYDAIVQIDDAMVADDILYEKLAISKKHIVQRQIGRR